MCDGVKEEVTFTHQCPLTGQRGKVQLSFPSRRRVREEALHAERVSFLQGGGARPPRAGAVCAARRDLLLFCRGSLVLVILQLAEVVSCLVTAGFRAVPSRALGRGKVDVNIPVNVGGLLLAVGELGDPAVAL